MKKNYRKRTRRKSNTKVSALFLLIVIVLIATIIFIITNTNPFDMISKWGKNSTNDSSQVSSDKAKEPEKIIPPDTTIKMSVIGDIMCHNSQYNDAYDSATKTYDFSYVFTDIEKYIQPADIAVGNLETTFAGAARGYSNYPTFNSPEALAYDLKELGIDFLTTANNHSMDTGYTGLVSTLNFLDDAGIPHTGTYRSEEEQNTIQVLDVKGIKIAFIAFTYGTNGIPVPKGKEYSVNLLDKDLISKQIELAKAKKPDLICAFMHWGVEYQTKENKEQDNYADFLFQNGVDLILGGHSHVLQPMQKRTITLEDGTTKDGFVIFSQGNFISGQRDTTGNETRTTAILSITLTKNGETGRMTVDEVDYVPCYMYKSSAKTKSYKLIDIEATLAKYDSGEDKSIGATMYNSLKQKLSFAKKILGDPIKKVIEQSTATTEDTSKNNN